MHSQNDTSAGHPLAPLGRDPLVGVGEGHRVEVGLDTLLLGEYPEDLADGYAREIVKLLFAQRHPELQARLEVRLVETSHGVDQRAVTVYA